MLGDRFSKLRQRFDHAASHFGEAVDERFVCLALHVALFTEALCGCLASECSLLGMRSNE